MNHSRPFSSVQRCVGAGNQGVLEREEGDDVGGRLGIYLAEDVGIGVGDGDEIVCMYYVYVNRSNRSKSPFLFGK